jgi:hypothetical protein
MPLFRNVVSYQLDLMVSLLLKDTIRLQLLFNYYTTLTKFFLISIIRYVGTTYRKIDLMVSLKKKIVRVVQILYRSCKRIISHYKTPYIY